MIVRYSSRLHRKQAPLEWQSKEVIIVLNKKLSKTFAVVYTGSSWFSLMMFKVNPSESYRAGIRFTGAELRNH